MFNELDFPLLSTTVHQHRLAYLDNASTTQKPQVVLDALQDYYLRCNANIHRGVHALSAQATELYEKARETVADFIRAPDAKNCIFTKGTTEAINLLAHGFGKACLRPGDNLIISVMEHHSNIVPWQMLCENLGVELRVIPLKKISDFNQHKRSGGLDLEAFEALIDQNTKLISLNYVSNTLGLINPIESFLKIAQQHKIPVCLDAAQAVAHLPVDVQKLGCDFLVFSGHKLYGPTGIGVLYAKADWLEILPPYQGGGDMILHVSFEKTTYNKPPYKFEAGTPPIAEAIGLAAAIRFVKQYDWQELMHYESKLNRELEQALNDVPGIVMIDPAEALGAGQKIGITAFNLLGVHPHDVGSILDQSGVAIRTGHHCTQPLLKALNLEATARVSLAPYNNSRDIEQFIGALQTVREIFK